MENLLRASFSSNVFFSSRFIFRFFFRYKNSITDRYRDLPGKCDRYLPPPHYLAESSSIVSAGSLIGNSSADSYIGGYLSSTVHTPVKRYVPTTNVDIYSDGTSNSSQQTQNQQHNDVCIFCVFKIR